MVMGDGASTVSDVAQLTRLQTEPHKLFGRRLPGKPTLPISPVKMLAHREANFSGRSRFSSADCCHVVSRYLPENGPHVIDEMDGSCYVSQFSHDGSLFVAAFQGGRIKIYDVDSGWKVRNYIHTAQAGLEQLIIDTSISPDKCHLIYANLSENIYEVNIGSAPMKSSQNIITDIHQVLDFSAGNDINYDNRIISVKFSTDGRELVASSSNASIYVYDLGACRVSQLISAHKFAVNTACFADESGHIIYSGSDDGLCKVWDRRCHIENEQASATLVGHLDSVTYIDSRGDGRHLISNARDHTIKLWDIRKMSSNLHPNPIVYRRISPWEGRGIENFKRKVCHPNDISLATYRGHEVFYTPIRCYFSPEKSTGQKYIYTGSADNSVYIYDLLSGAQVAKLHYHKRAVRDCSWHPYFPYLVSSSLDGVIAKWDF